MGQKVLVVEDELTTIGFLKKVLTGRGFSVITASNGKEALELIESDLPDIIISDVMMPEMDGFELYRSLLQSSRTAEIPFIFLSANNDPAEQLKGLRMGADEYLTKPLNTKSILETMDRALEKARRLKKDDDVDFSGNLDQVGITEIVQVIEINSKTGEVTISDESGRRRGIILFKTGNLFHASAGTLTGDEAFYELAALRKGSFRFVIKEPDMVENLSGQNMVLLFEAARLADESGSLNSMISNPSARFKIISENIPNSIRKRTAETHLEKIMELIKAGHPLPEIIDKSGISTPHAKAVIVEFLRTKIIEEDRVQKEDAKKTGFPMLVKGNLVKQLKKIDGSEFTGKIDIQGRSRPAAIHIRKGKIINANHGHTTGKKALFRIFSERGGVCKIINAAIDAEQVISEPIDALFEEASQEIAWRKKMKTDFSNVMVRLNQSHEPSNNGEYEKAGYKEILRIITGHDNLKQIIDQSPFTDLRTITILNELKKKGAISFKIVKEE